MNTCRNERTLRRAIYGWNVDQYEVPRLSFDVKIMDCIEDRFDDRVHVIC